MSERTRDEHWMEFAAEVREVRKLRPFGLDEVGTELRNMESQDLTEEHISKVMAFATSNDSMPPAERRHAGADPGVTRLLDEVTYSGLVSTEEIRALDEEEAAARRTPNDYVSEFARRNLLRTYQPERQAKGLGKGVLFADYLLLDTVGVGGMGEVFRALHLRMNRIVALKVVSEKASAFRKNLIRFDSEAKALAKLDHPNIVRAYDASEAGGVPYLVMEFVDGSDLARLVYRLGPLTSPLAIGYSLQVARGLDYAHREGVIHRDVKPSNILVGSDGVVKISDLGLAKFVLLGAHEDRDVDATASGLALGTYSYMSPEQADGSDDVDARSDIYGLGCTLCFLLLGRPPAEGSSNDAKLQWHREGVIPSLRTHLPELPERLDVIFRRMLAKSPDKRPQSMREVIEELEACQLLLRKPSIVRAEFSATVDWPAKAGTKAKSAFKRQTRWLLLVALAVLACLPIGLMVRTFSGGTGQDREASGVAADPLAAADPSETAAADVPPAAEPALPGFTNDVHMHLTLISPGEFWMGTKGGNPREQPRHKVHISHRFYIGTHEVNRRQYQEVMAPLQRIPEFQHRDDEPAAVDPGALPQVNVTWEEAHEFCRQLSERSAEKRAGRTYRLPTEAEWEYCCCAGTQTAFSTGDDITLEQANFGAGFRPPTIKFPGRPRLLEVGSFPPNPFGLHDMHGNALEWCKDRYGEYEPDAMTDPDGAKDGEHRVVRGGATTYEKNESRSASRRYKHPDETNDFTGFRVVCLMKTE